jgi:hypothetical protein
MGIGPLKLKETNVGRHRHYSSYYHSQKVVETVGNLFREDIQAFGYRFERPGLYGRITSAFRRSKLYLMSKTGPWLQRK